MGNELFASWGIEPDPPVSPAKPSKSPGDHIPREDVVLVFDIWRFYAHKSVQVQLSDKRAKLIRKALATNDMQTVLDAVIGWRFSDWHRGVNDSHKQYNSLELILRDQAKIEQFAGYTREAGETAPRQVPDQQVEAPDSGGYQPRVGTFTQSGAW